MMPASASDDGEKNSFVDRRGIRDLRTFTFTYYLYLDNKIQIYASLFVWGTKCFGFEVASCFQGMAVARQTRPAMPTKNEFICFPDGILASVAQFMTKTDCALVRDHTRSHAIACNFALSCVVVS